MKHLVSLKIGAMVLAVAALGAVSVIGARAGFGNLFYEGGVVRTVVPPAAMKKTGTDALYIVNDGVDGQLPVAAVAPGDPGYRGGKWAVHFVDWEEGVEPYLLTSEAEVLEAEALGEIAVARDAAADFKCPIQP